MSKNELPALSTGQKLSLDLEIVKLQGQEVTAHQESLVDLVRLRELKEDLYYRNSSGIGKLALAIANPVRRTIRKVQYRNGLPL